MGGDLGPCNLKLSGDVGFSMIQNHDQGDSAHPHTHSPASGAVSSSSFNPAILFRPDRISIAHEPLAPSFPPLDLESLDTRSYSQSGARYLHLCELRAILRNGSVHGDGSQIEPFSFNVPGVHTPIVAPNGGLEGFCYRLKQITRDLAPDPLLHHLHDYYHYTVNLLSHIPAAADGLSQIQELWKNHQTPDGSIRNGALAHSDLLGFLELYVEAIKSQVAVLDNALWIREARIYEIFPRFFNLAGFHEKHGVQAAHSGTFYKDFTDADFDILQQQGWNTLYILGNAPVGKVRALGTAGGSPFSISDYAGIHPENGTRADFIETVARAHDRGMRVMTDLVFNHTSFDSALLAEDPTYFIHRPASVDPENPGSYLAAPKGFYLYHQQSTGQAFYIREAGYYDDRVEGKRCYYTDVAQLDLSNQRTRDRLIEITLDEIEQTGVDGFRVDMAHQLLKAYYDPYILGPDSPLPEYLRPQREFLEELITRVKSRFPHVAFMAEGHDKWDQLCQVGFDAVIGKNDIGRIGDHRGWFDNLFAGNNAREQADGLFGAINQKILLDKQLGGAAMIVYPADHDVRPLADALRHEGKPQEQYEALTALTLLAGQGPVLFQAGHENFGVGTYLKNIKDQRFPSFEVPTTTRWTESAPETDAFYKRLYGEIAAISSFLGTQSLESLRYSERGPCAGYTLHSKSTDPVHRGRQVIVVANLADTLFSTNLSVTPGNDPDRTAGTVFLSIDLKPFEYRVLFLDPELSSVRELIL